MRLTVFALPALLAVAWGASPAEDAVAAIEGATQMASGADKHAQTISPEDSLAVSRTVRNIRFLGESTDDAAGVVSNQTSTTSEKAKRKECIGLKILGKCVVDPKKSGGIIPDTSGGGKRDAIFPSAGFTARRDTVEKPQARKFNPQEQDDIYQAYTGYTQAVNDLIVTLEDKREVIGSSSRSSQLSKELDRLAAYAADLSDAVGSAAPNYADVTLENAKSLDKAIQEAIGDDNSANTS